MYRAFRQLLAGIVLLAVLVSLAACGKQTGGTPDPSYTGAEQPAAAGADSGQMDQVYYSQSIYPFAGGGGVYGVARLGSTLFLYGRRDSTQLLGMVDYTEAENGRVSLGETVILPLDAPDEADEAWIYDITAGGDGYLYVLTGEMPPEILVRNEWIKNPEGEANYVLLKYAPSGEFVEKMSVSQWEGGRIGNILADADGGIAVDGNGTVLLYSTGAYSLIDWQSGVRFTNILGEMLFLGSVSLCEDGFIAAMQDASMDYFAAQVDSPFYRIDGDSGEARRLELKGDWEDEDYVNLMFSGTMGDYQGLDGEYVAIGTDIYYAIDPTSGSFASIRPWNYSGCGAYNTCRLTETAYVSAGELDGGLFLNGLELVPHREHSTVSVAFIRKSEYGADPAQTIARMNAQDSYYTYELTTYGPSETARFLTELGAGTAPDLVLFENNIHVNSDLFEDLNRYLEEDPELSRDSFIPGLLDALSSGGALRQLWPTVQLDTLIVREADVAGLSKLTTRDYDRILEEKGYKAYFQSYITKSYLLNMVAMIGIAAYADMESGTCHFDNPVFTELLAWCGDMVDDWDGEVAPETLSYGMEEILLFREGLVSVDRMAALEEYCVFGEPYAFVGFPDGGDGMSFYTCFDLAMAIPAGSANKAGAWEFIRSQLLTDAQMNISYGLPVNNEALQNLANAKLDSAGVLKLNAFLNTVTDAQTYADTALRDIIIDCGKSFLNEGRSPEEMVKLIQSRASVFMAEQYGY